MALRKSYHNFSQPWADVCAWDSLRQTILSSLAVFCYWLAADMAVVAFFLPGLASMPGWHVARTGLTQDFIADESDYPTWGSFSPEWRHC